MRLRALVGCMTLLGALWLPAAAAGSHSEHPGGPRDFAVGSAKNTFLPNPPFADFLPNHLMVSAHGTGPDVTGHVRAKGELPTDFKLEGEVTCLRVEGDKAAIKYRFKHAEGSAEPLEGGGVQVFVWDRHGEAPDANTFDPPQPAVVFQTNERFCDSPNSRAGYDPVDSGNYTVHQAPPSAGP